MARYQPPTRVVTTQTPYLALVTAADPQWATGKFREPYFLDGIGRQVYFNPYTSGSFNSNSGVYPVGQQSGAQDPLVVAARPMYSGTPDGKGWA